MGAPTPHTLEIKVRPAQGAAKVVHLAGAASMDTGTELRDRLLELLDPGTRLLVLDLSNLEFINSVGLGGIVAAHLRCRRIDGEIHLAAPQPAIRELLHVTRLTKLFPIHESVEAAMAHA